MFEPSPEATEWLELQRRGLWPDWEAKRHRLVCGNPWIDPFYPELGRDIQQLTINMASGPDVWERDPLELFKGRPPMCKTPKQLGQTAEPAHRHDCDQCVFKGSGTEANGNPVDVYRCEQHGIPTWVGRYGSGGPDYTTLPEHMILDRASGVHPIWDAILPFAIVHLDSPEPW